MKETGRKGTWWMVETGVSFVQTPLHEQEGTGVSFVQKTPLPGWKGRLSTAGSPWPRLDRGEVFLIFVGFLINRTSVLMRVFVFWSHDLAE